MKILKTMPVLLLAAFMATSCGKENSSGSNSGSTSVAGVGIDGIVTGGGTVFGNIEDVKTRFNAISFSTGVSQNTEILHVGTRYASNSGGGSTTILGFLEIDWNTNSGTSYRALRVNSSTQDSVNVTKATGSNYYGFTYDGGVASELNRSSKDYREMLGLDNVCANTQVTEITITTQISNSNNNGNQGQQGTIKGNEIKCFGNNGQMIRYSIVSDAIPVAANPIFIQTQQSIGYLAKIGNTYITGAQ